MNIFKTRIHTATAALTGAVLMAGAGLAVAPAAHAAPAPVLPTQVSAAGLVQATRTTASVAVGAGDILSFEQVSGQPAWIERAKARVQNGVWVFDDNGTFTFNTTDVRTDLFPLQGRASQEGNRIVFSGNAFTRIGGSSAFTEMQGSIDLSGAAPVMTLEWANGAGYGAVVNNQKFGATASSHYIAQLTLVAR